MEDEVLYQVVKRDDGSSVLSFKCELCEGTQSFNIEYYPKVNLLLCDECKKDLKEIILNKRSIEKMQEKIEEARSKSSFLAARLSIKITPCNTCFDERECTKEIKDSSMDKLPCWNRNIKE